ncbi:helix-turn-helix transcriptional regulator [Corynebacterium kutscheri]|uniref:helix-turn-helix transcriptional regulator n=1 Tax=Corynebacterium kutscheri TaxID=35755 RepID=UPI0037C04F33
MAKTPAVNRVADLVRLLNLLPYLQSHPHNSLMETATDLGLSPAEMMHDLRRLHCCGYGNFHDELVDLTIDYAQVQVLNSQGLDKPLRLTHTEAGALLLSLEALEAMPGLFNQEVVRSAAAKLREIVGVTAQSVFDAPAHGYDLGAEALMEVVRQAVDKHVRLQFNYYSRHSDSLRMREVSVARIFTHERSVYITGWDHEVQEHRTFRVDRMHDVYLGDKPATPNENKFKFNPANPFGFESDMSTVTLQVHKEDAWVLDSLPIELESTSDSPWLTGVIPLVSQTWLVRFAISHADRIKVVAPAEIVKLLAKRVQLGLNAYDTELNN